MYFPLEGCGRISIAPPPQESGGGVGERPTLVEARARAATSSGLSPNRPRFLRRRGDQNPAMSLQGQTTPAVAPAVLLLVATPGGARAENPPKCGYPGCRKPLGPPPITVKCYDTNVSAGKKESRKDGERPSLQQGQGQKAQGGERR